MQALIRTTSRWPADTRAFIGFGDGWLADADVTATADDIAEHVDRVSSVEPFSVPGNIYEELFNVVGRMRVDIAGGGWLQD